MIASIDETARPVTTITVQAELTLVDVSMATRAILRRIAENQTLMALFAGNSLVRATQLKIKLVVIEVRGDFHFRPVIGAMAASTVRFHGSVRRFGSCRISEQDEKEQEPETFHCRTPEEGSVAEV